MRPSPPAPLRADPSSAGNRAVIFFVMYFMFSYGILGGVNPYYGYWTLTCYNSTFAVCLVLTAWSLIVRYGSAASCTRWPAGIDPTPGRLLMPLHEPIFSCVNRLVPFRSWTWPMWTGLGISFAIYFVGIFVLDGLSETYYDIPCTTTGRVLSVFC